MDDLELLNGNIGVARAFDNRIGSWAIIEALRMAGAAKQKPKCAVFASSSVQEEVGCIGASMSVINIKPHAAVAVDVTHATDTPGVDAKEHGEIKLGKGPTVSIGRENHPLVVHRLQKIAKKKRINLQVEAFSLTGGTDARVIHNKLGGVPSAVLSVPNRYMHTTVEMLDLRDLQHTAELLAAFLGDLKSGERFKVKI